MFAIQTVCCNLLYPILFVTSTRTRPTMVGNCRLSGHIQTIYCLICRKIARSLGIVGFDRWTVKKVLNSSRCWQFHWSVSSFICKFLQKQIKFFSPLFADSIKLGHIEGLFFSSKRSDPRLQKVSSVLSFARDVIVISPRSTHLILSTL